MGKAQILLPILLYERAEDEKTNSRHQCGIYVYKGPDANTGISNDIDTVVHVGPSSSAYRDKQPQPIYHLQAGCSLLANEL
jgi:hypothetical protein